MATCPNCNKEFENLGAHLRFCKKVEKPEKPEEKIVVDILTKDKRLSDLMSEIKLILNRYQNKTIITVSEDNGRPVDLEITMRIRL